ncbi:hypothetical protein [Marinibacterium sp. SX1]|uniref:hypothetical protein n=1 Tax=Marinibacterium sp. SX1 TaxID=3388424 RepID=UPI003D1830B5
MTFRPSKLTKSWPKDSAEYGKLNPKSQKIIDTLAQTASWAGPLLKRVRAELADGEDGLKKLTDINKALPKLQKAMNDEIDKTGRLVAELMALELDIAAKQKELAAAPKDKALKKQLDALIKQHRSKDQVANICVNGIAMMKANFNAVTLTAYLEKAKLDVFA